MQPACENCKQTDDVEREREMKKKKLQNERSDQRDQKVSESDKKKDFLLLQSDDRVGDLIAREILCLFKKIIG